ncbi:MAG: phosphatase PAP2 family protein [Pirellulales bacterium]|nr:phosphatase PAP2 family protein [Pirellulales bacterium]
MTEPDPRELTEARRRGADTLIRSGRRESRGPSGPAEWAVVVASAILLSFLIIDPLALQAVRQFDDGTRAFFRSFTDLGKSDWILIPAGAAVIGCYLFRTREYRLRHAAASGLGLQLAAFVFVAVAATSLAGSLAKNIIGRARPKLFDSMGPIEFQPMTFTYDFASFPSGHATTIFAFAAVLAIFWPRARVFLFVAAAWIAATRFLIGSHFFTDAVGGALLGFWGPYFLRDLMARRRWLFEHRDGEIRLRMPRLRCWVRGEVRGSLLPRSDSMAQSG